jgi:hypothetical protein
MSATRKVEVKLSLNEVSPNVRKGYRALRQQFSRRDAFLLMAGAAAAVDDGVLTLREVERSESCVAAEETE